MVTFKFHIKAPLFVVRQWQRHRMSCFNEISGRYSVIDNSFWYPEEFRKQALINKQSSADKLETHFNKDLLYEYKLVNTECYNFYHKLLNLGVSREMARTILPLNTYTEFYWKIDLHNLLRFIKLRNDKHAQEEIRLYAQEIKEIVKEYCPVTIDAFENFTEKSIKFSNEELKVITKEENIDSLKSKSGKADFINKINKINKIFFFFIINELLFT
jgi:thymidylate synthase (FAD)